METLDILDKEGNRTGRTITRGEAFKEGEYHLVVHIWIMNSKGEILIQKRADHLKYAPGIWATTGGCALQGEDSITAARREAKEELGIDINPINEPIRYIDKKSLTDIWIAETDSSLNDMQLQKEEVSDVKWVSNKELKSMLQKGDFFRSSDEYFELIADYIKIN